MSKYLYPSPGQIILFCQVTTVIQGKAATTTEIGTNSGINIFRQHKELVENAKLNALYKHLKRTNRFVTYKKSSKSVSQFVEILDFDFNYFDNLVTRKRVKRKNSSGKEKIYSVSISKETGKQTGQAHIWREAELIEDEELQL